MVLPAQKEQTSIAVTTRRPRRIGAEVMGQTSFTTTMKATHDLFPIFNLQRDFELKSSWL